MHVTFGLDLDGVSYPSVLTDVAAARGRWIVGPRGLLNLLETHCGLLGNYAGEAVRVALYAERLSAGDSTTAFFHRSLQRDRWGTARTLLGWRDALVGSGWQGQPCGAPRPDDLAAIERISTPALPAGTADRLRAVLRTLPGVRLPIAKITHAEPLALLPLRWREVLEACRVPLEPVPPATTVAPGAGDLVALQALLLCPTAPASRPVGDGSIICLRDLDPWQTADGLAAWLAANPDPFRGALIVRGGSPHILDQALRRYNLAALGSAPRSAARPATQVLALAFAIAWKPLDPYRLLEFLMLPVSPLPARAAAILARTFREVPGVSGSYWKKAWDDAITAAADRGARHPALDDDADLAAEVDLLAAIEAPRSRRENTPGRIRRRLERWLGPQTVAAFDATAGIPRETARAIAGRVAQWAEGRARAAREVPEPVLRAAARQAADMREMLSVSSACDTIPRPQIEQMLDQVLREGSVAFAVPAEARHLACVDAPGCVLADAPAVIWWHFAAPAEAHIPRSPWSDDEVKALRLPLDDPRTAMLAAAWRWKQPVLRARRQLILVTPDAALGRAIQGHPLQDEIRARFCPALADEKRITRTVRSFLEADATVPDRAPRIERFAIRSRERPQTEWQISPGLVVPPPRESASSLESLLACPFQWLLRYVLELRGGALAGLSDGSRLKGTLAHDLLEELLPPGPVVMDPQEAWNPAAAAFDRRLPEQASALLMPERTVERLQLRDELARAAAALIRGLRAADLAVRGTEEEREAPLDDGAVVCGRLDLLLEHPGSGAAVLLDFKFGHSRYYQPRLQAGTAVQLATYAWLARGDAVPLLQAGYFCISAAELLAQARDLFPTATPVAGPAMAATWERVVAGRKQRLERLRAGVVETARSAPDPEALPLESPCGLCDYDALCPAKEAPRAH